VYLSGLSMGDADCGGRNDLTQIIQAHHTRI
jgi:hypothetical protein